MAHSITVTPTCVTFSFPITYTVYNDVTGEPTVTSTTVLPLPSPAIRNGPPTLKFDYPKCKFGPTIGHVIFLSCEDPRYEYSTEYKIPCGHNDVLFNQLKSIIMAHKN